MPDRSKKEQMEALFREVLNDRPTEEERNDHKPGSASTLKQCVHSGKSPSDIHRGSTRRKRHLTSQFRFVRFQVAFCATAFIYRG
ncbi:hypothetical protein ElyMa_007061300 [Elysia marginata]|uniref:Uncharacterized protein n=1 Tax=Elysia marginata TaxID=1093978 RepID=A0AAV4JVF3_9GAST|nr:hypothetical protein ElyMa_007061300 [Elysia marginata]